MMSCGQRPLLLFRSAWLAPTRPHAILTMLSRMEPRPDRRRKVRIRPGSHHGGGSGQAAPAADVVQTGCFRRPILRAVHGCTLPDATGSVVRPGPGGCQGLCGGLDMGRAPGARTDALQVTPSFEQCRIGMSDQMVNVSYINRSIKENEDIRFCGKR